MEKLVNAKTCNDEIFNLIYDELMDLASSENHGMYMEALHRAKTNAQRKACQGCYVGSWQKVFNAWCKGKLPNIYVTDAIRSGFVSESLLPRCEE